MISAPSITRAHLFSLEKSDAPDFYPRVTQGFLLPGSAAQGKCHAARLPRRVTYISPVASRSKTPQGPAPQQRERGSAVRVQTESRCQSLTGSKVSAVTTGIDRKSDGLFRSMASSPYSHNQSVVINIMIAVWILGLELSNSCPFI